MNEAVGAIELLERETRKRLRLLAIQDLIGLSLVVSVGLALFAIVLLWSGVLDGRFESGVGARERLLLLCIPVTAAGLLLATRYIVTRRARWRSNLDASANQVDLL